MRAGSPSGRRARARRSLALCEEVYGPDHPHTASALTILGGILCKERCCAEALPLYRRSLEIREARLGDKHVELVFSLEGLAGAHLELGEPGPAVPLLERAVALLEGIPERELDAAEIRFELARALWAAPRERARARTLARAALDEFAASSDARATEVRGWLDQREGRR